MSANAMLQFEMLLRHFPPTETLVAGRARVISLSVVNCGDVFLHQILTRKPLTALWADKIPSISVHRSNVPPKIVLVTERFLAFLTGKVFLLAVNN